MSTDLERFNAAIARFDAANTEDPTTEVFQGAVYPKELLYAQRMTMWLDQLAPDASEALRLAVRCQHIRRWTIPRHTYAMDRRGYLRWRTTLAKFHADTAAAILRDVGYDAATIQRVQTLLRKEGLKRDPEVQCRIWNSALSTAGRGPRTPWTRSSDRRHQSWVWATCPGEPCTSSCSRTSTSRPRRFSRATSPAGMISSRRLATYRTGTASPRTWP